MICRVNEFEGKKKQLSRDLSKAYYKLAYLQNRHKVYHQVDSLYARVSDAAKISHEGEPFPILKCSMHNYRGGSPLADSDATRY